MSTTLAQLMEQAVAAVDTVEAATAKNMVGDANTQFVDVRDLRELQEHGKVPGAIHASRGMLEFLIDPQSPYHDKAFVPAGATEGKRYVIYCKSGGRSALAAATMKEMGYHNICHMAGGFQSWQDLEGEIEQVDD